VVPTARKPIACRRQNQKSHGTRLLRVARTVRIGGPVVATRTPSMRARRTVRISRPDASRGRRILSCSHLTFPVHLPFCTWYTDTLLVLHVYSAAEPRAARRLNTRTAVHFFVRSNQALSLTQSNVVSMHFHLVLFFLRLLFLFLVIALLFTSTRVPCARYVRARGVVCVRTCIRCVFFTLPSKTRALWKADEYYEIVLFFFVSVRFMIIVSSLYVFCVHTATLIDRPLKTTRTWFFFFFVSKSLNFPIVYLPTSRKIERRNDQFDFFCFV